MSYHFNVTFVSRGKGQSLVAKGAYQARDKFREERTGELKDYTYKADRPVASFVFIDKKHGAELQDNEKLLNAIDARENQKNSQTGLNFIGALPDKLTDEERARMVRDFGREQFFRKGIAAVAHIHRPSEQGDDRNHHVHFLASTRTLGADGKFGAKFITWDNYDKQLEQWRGKWAEIGARYLEQAGHHQEAERWRYGHLKNELQREKALERCDTEWAEKKAQEASTHRGPVVDAMEKNGQQTDRGNIYRDTNERNQQQGQDAAALKRELAEIRKAITQHEREWAEQQRAAALARGTQPAPPQKEVAKPAAPQLGKTAGEIRQAYSRTNTGPEFANALEDRGLILAKMTEADAERLNRWEQQRHRELAGAEPDPRQAQGRQDAAPAPQRTAEKKTPTTRAVTWMAQTGGVDALAPELLDSAQRSYEKWDGDKERYSLANYVDYVQGKEQKRRENGEPEKKAGEIRLYRGIGNNVWPAEHAGGPLFLSTDPARAAAFGKLHYIDVPAAEMAKFERPHSQRILEQEPIAANDWRTADPAIIARLKPLESAEPQIQLQSTGQQERYKVGELVVVNQQGHIVQLTASNTGDGAKARAEHLKDIDRAALPSVSAAEGAMKEFRLHRQKERPEIQAQPPAERAADIKPLRGTAIDIRVAYRTSDSAKAFVASLADRDIMLAVVTKHEAEESRKQAEAEKAAGRFPNATGLKENEIVAVNQRGHVQRFTERITGSSFGDMQAYLRNLDRSQFSGGIEETRRYVRGRVDEENRLQKDRDRTAKSILGMLNIFDAGYDDQRLSKTVLDRAERRTIENERAASRPRNTRDR